MYVSSLIADRPHAVHRKVRMADIARLAGVSVATVSRSLNDSPAINRLTKSRVWQVARDSGYVSGHDVPETLRDLRATVAVLVPASGGDGPDILPGLIVAARDLRCNLLVVHLDAYGPGAQDVTTAMRRLSTDGVADAYVVMGTGRLDTALDRAAADGHRFVAWGQAAPDAQHPSAGPDDFACGVLAVRSLAARGCRRIAYVGDTGSHSGGARQRFRGYLTALDNAGLTFDANLLHAAVPAGGDFDGMVIATDQCDTPVDVPVICLSPRADTAARPTGTVTLSIDGQAAARALLSGLLGAAPKPADAQVFPVRIDAA